MKATHPSLFFSGVHLKSVALPSEHGGWGFLVEPILLGSLVAGSVSGLILSLAIVSTFLIHQPLKIALKDHLKRRRSPRTAWAERFVAGYSGFGIVLLYMIALNADPRFVVPLLLAFPFLLVQVGYDARNQSRASYPKSVARWH
jgi:hypothetical protein